MQTPPKQVPLVYALLSQVFSVPTLFVLVSSIPIKVVFKIVIAKKVVTSEEVLSNTRVFNSRFVNEIKDLYINKAHRKSRLIIQGHNNNNNVALTQLPILQWVYIQLISIFH